MESVINALGYCLKRLATKAFHVVRLPPQTAPAGATAAKLIAPHLHDACEMKIVLKGSLKCRFPAGSLTVRPGEILIIPPGLIHADTKAADLTRGCQWLNLWFEHEVLGLCNSMGAEKSTRFLTAEQHAQLSAALMQSPANLYAHLYKLSRDKGPYVKKALHGFIYIFFALLTHVLTQSSPARRKAAELVSRAISHMTIMCYDPRFSARDIARAINRSPSYLAYLFKQEKQASVCRTLMNIRLDRAYRLLQGGKYSVKEVAYYTGWSNSLYFSTRFRKKYGIPPSQIMAINPAAGVYPRPKHAAGKGD